MGAVVAVGAPAPPPELVASLEEDEPEGPDEEIPVRVPEAMAAALADSPVEAAIAAMLEATALDVDVVELDPVVVVVPAVVLEVTS